MTHEDFIHAIDKADEGIVVLRDFFRQAADELLGKN